MPDIAKPTTPGLEPATIAVIEIEPLTKLINEIRFELTDFACFEFARMDDNRITVLFSIKRKVDEDYVLLVPNNDPKFAYLDVHDLIPPPPEEDQWK